jgi:hypothetical protein
MAVTPLLACVFERRHRLERSLGAAGGHELAIGLLDLMHRDRGIMLAESDEAAAPMMACDTAWFGAAMISPIAPMRSFPLLDAALPGT